MSLTLMQEISDRAQIVLKTSPLYALRMVTVQELDDCLVLTGRVSTFYQKQQAQELVRSVAGSALVTNQIEVT